jgi:hypothetical protein
LELGHLLLVLLVCVVVWSGETREIDSAER